MNDDLVKRVKETVDIIDLVSSYINLEKRGDKYIGICPFHNESKPSFTVDQDRGFYYCFGCQKGGDLIKFVESMEKVQFKEALRFLCEKYNISYNKHWKKEKNDINYIYKINHIALQHFFTNIHRTKEGQKAIKYLNHRGIGIKTIEEFNVGYSLDSWNSLYNILKKSYSDTELFLSGLFKKNNRGFLYDAYRGRVIFPIKDIHGRIVGFGGRTLNDGQEEAKYINSPKTPVYEKGRNLYCIDLSRKHISRLNSAVLVEGYLDAVSLYQGGIKNVVACLGTALTEAQVQLLKRYCSRLYLCFDSDEAGIKSALSNYDIFQKYELDTYYLDISPSKDPDDFIKSYGPEALGDRIEKAGSLEDIVINNYIKSVGNEEKSIDKNLFLNTVSRLLSIKDYIKRHKYFNELSAMLKTDSRTILKEYERLGKTHKVHTNKGPVSSGTLLPQNETKILKAFFLMKRSEVFDFKESLYEIISLQSPLRKLLDLVNSTGPDSMGTLLRENIPHFDESLAGIIIRVERELDSLTDDGKQELLESMSEKLHRAMLDKLQDKILKAKDRKELDRLLKVKIAIKKKLLQKRKGGA